MVGKYFFEFFVVEATLTFDLYVTFLNVALETIDVAKYFYTIVARLLYKSQ